MNVLHTIVSHLDRFTTGIIIAVLLGLALPCEGAVAVGFDWLTNAAIVMLFFLYGAKLSRQSVIDGLLHWRLQLMVFALTFVLFPLLLPLLRPALEALVGASLFMGLLYVACLPSTVQSSIAFTSLAGGNVPAAVCSASVSSLLGVFLTPLLVSLIFAADAAGGSGADVGLDTVLKVCTQILLPFILGQLSQRRLGRWVQEHRRLIGWNDQITIWLVVYSSFAKATVSGYWTQLEWQQLGGLIAACLIVLAIVQAVAYLGSRLLGFSREDRITIVFCGSKKSLAVGAPMMMAIFGALDNNLLLPLMIFHQVQLMACAQLARIWRQKGADTGGY